MKILEHTYNNPAISIHVNEISLDNAGIYLLEGENGTGKTSIIENMLRSKKIEIPGEYKDNISYFCQEDKRYDVSVGEYLACENMEYRKEITSILGIDYFHKRVTEISGGEYTKIKFARTILKASKLMIFDEPTNNLDDDVTEKVERILNAVSQHCLIIIISHDPRLQLQVTKKLVIENNAINVYVCENKIKTLPSCNDIKSDLIYNSSYFRRSFFSKMNLITVIFLVLLAIVLGNVFDSILSPRISTNPIIGRNDYLELMNIGSICGDGYDDSYLTASNSCEGYQLFDSDEIKELAKLPYVKNVYVVDTFYDVQYFESDMIYYDALPTIISASPYQERAFACSSGFLVSGRLPEDSSNEFATSISIMKDHYGIDESINSLIDREVKVDGKKMKLVGILQNDAICLSYNEQTESSIVVYSETNFDRIKLIENMLLENSNQEGIDRVYIEYDGAYYENVIDFIADKGASYQVNSDIFTSQIQLRQYTSLWGTLLAVTVGISIVLVVVLNAFTKKAYIYKKNELSDLSDLTFEYHKEKVVFHLTLVIDMLISLLVAIIIINGLLNNNVILDMTIPFTVISFIIMYSLLVLLRFVANRNKHDI